jgi:hypothetical protein
LEAQQGGDVHDLSNTTLEHGASRALAEAKDTGEICSDNIVPIGNGVIDSGSAARDACVIDQDVDGAKGVDGVADELRTVIWIAKVGRKRNVANASCGDPLYDVGGDRPRPVKGDIGARLCESDCNRRAHPARRAGDKRILTSKSKRIEDQSNFSCGVTLS